MSKELEALKQVKNFLGYNYCSVDLPNELKLIEQALQRLESIDNANPSEALKRLERVDDYVDKDYDYCQRGDYDKDYNVIKQALLKAQEQEKVLEIIKEKNVDIHWIKKCKTLDEYNDMLNAWELELTQEEFDLLKKVFK